MYIEGSVTKLRTAVRNKKSVLVAYSGGVDSSVVAKVCRDELGDKTMAVIAKSETFPQREMEGALRTAEEIEIPLRVIETSELKYPEISANPINRCYHCKKHLFIELKKIAELGGFSTVADGVNCSDFGEHRPGIRASDELGIWHPLVECGFTKEEVREIASLLDLNVKDKPSTACLSSRIPYGEEVTEEKLGMIERAEDFILSLGLRQVRVRHYTLPNGILARIEVPLDDIEIFLSGDMRKKVVEHLGNIGYTYVTVDLEGYTAGSMDRVLESGRSNEK